jgi:hypothetical protein
VSPPKVITDILNADEDEIIDGNFLSEEAYRQNKFHPN